MTREQILERGTRWADAERRGDVAALDTLLADDFVGIGPRGFTLTKEQWLARYRADALRNESFALEDVAVRLYGDTAVATGRQVQRTQYRDPGGEFRDASGQFRTSLVCVRQAGGWRIAGWQASGPLPDVPPSRG